MARIPFTVTKITSSGKKKIKLPLPSKGVNFNSENMKSTGDRCVTMKNLICTDSCISSRGTFEKSTVPVFEQGSFHSMTSRDFCGKNIIHAGTVLYGLCEDEGEAQVIFEGVPDKNSFFCEFGSKLYLYCDSHVYSVDRDFNCTEQFPEAPLYMEKIRPSTGMQGEKVEDFRYNFIAPFISVKFDGVDGDYYFVELPLARDMTREVKIYYRDKPLTLNESKCTEKVLYTEENLKNKEVTVEYCLKDPSHIDFDDSFSKCTFCTTYGGTGSEGTRIFASGSEKRRGEYFKGELMNPLFFKSDSVEKLGDGSDGITCFAKMYDKLLIFTDRSIYKMSYSVTESGGFFGTVPINSLIGCDMPGSVRLVENRVVFASSREGVFIINSTAETGEMNIFPISGNINKTADGLLAVEKSMLTKAQSLDHDGKYILFAGGKMFIWDYSLCGFSASRGYENSQGCLVWYIWEGIEGDLLFRSSQSVFILDTQKGILSRYISEKQVSDGAFITEEQDFSLPHMKKKVYSMSFDMKSGKGSEVILTLYADGVPYYGVSIYSTKSERAHIDMKLPSVPCYRFSYGLASEDGFFELYGVSAKAVMVR